MTRILDQQFVVHLYAPTEGPDAVAAYRALKEIWRGCRLLFHMTESIPGVGLPQVLPEDLEALTGDGEVALAAQERPAADCQAIVRRHHDLLNLSVALAPPETSSPDGGDWPWWRTLDLQWHALTSPYAPHLLGEARLYLARLDAVPAIRDAAPELFDQLSGLLPDHARDWRGAHHGVPAPDGLALWETTSEPDDRTLRRFVLAMAPDADPAASAWVWSRGDTAIPPLARYLLHAAKLRYELRVWQRDGQTRTLQASLSSISTELVRLGASDSAKAELLRLRSFDAVLLLADLRALRRTVEIAADNLGRAFDLSGLLLPGGPFADDADLARSLLERLDDQLAYLSFAADRADGIIGLQRSPQPELKREPEPEPVARQAERPLEDDRSRNVFVIYGRDEPARVAVFNLLRALGLQPLEWEDLVKTTRKSAPFLGEVIAQAMPLVQAVVVLMTPEDVVRLHPDLHEPNETSAETRHTMQARPNVLLELGMALAVHPDRTLILTIGDQRPITDLGGRNYVRISKGPGFQEKIANRLQLAGCPVKTPEGGWLAAGDFSALTAHQRVP